LGTSYPTRVASGAANLLVVSPATTLPVSGDLPLVDWSYYTKTLVTNSVYLEDNCVQRNIYNGYAAPGLQFGTISAGAYTGGTNFITLFGNQSLSWCVSGAYSFSCVIGIPWYVTRDWGAQFSMASPMNVVFLTNGVVACSNQLSRSGGVSNVVFSLQGVTNLDCEVTCTNATGGNVDVIGLINGIISWPAAGYNQLTCQLVSGGGVRLSYVGMDGVSYALDRSVSLSPPNWMPQATNQAGANGMLVFTNAQDPLDKSFWRVRSASP
jgi:hypothetical protein